MKLRLKYMLEKLIQAALGLFYIFPVSQNKILFSSFSGRQYSDSPKRISDAMLNYKKECQRVWAFTEPEKYRYLEEQGIKVVKFKSLSFLYHAMTCRVYVDNVEFWSILKFRKEQMVLQTWHGGGAYKRIGADRLDVSDAELRHVVDKMRKNTVFVSSCKAFTDYVIHGAFKYGGEIMEVGLPRNDELVGDGGIDRDELRCELGIAGDSKVVLYAPTFRNSLTVDLYDVDMDRLRNALKCRFGGEWTVLLRLHYYMSGKHLAADGKFVVDVTSYPDMQHLLKLADVLVTDYSSTLWDFSLMKKPCFVYANDLEEYCTERNFYLPIEKWPFPVASGNDALEEAILNFDEAAYDAAVDAHMELLGSTETGRATELICERICKHIKEG